MLSHTFVRAMKGKGPLKVAGKLLRMKRLKQANIQRRKPKAIFTRSVFYEAVMLLS
jgi:hypothetical protein